MTSVVDSGMANEGRRDVVLISSWWNINELITALWWNVRQRLLMTQYPDTE